jgi:ribosomal protein L31
MLLAVIPVKETSAEVLFNTVCNKVEEHGIEISNLHRQCYDGASNVSVHTGLQARIKELSPSAHFTHCYGHVLNLVIVDTMNNNPIAKDFFGTLQNLYVFIETCSKRHAVYLDQQRKVNQASGEEEERKRVTRWACCADSIKAIHHTIKAVIATLEDILENEKKANIATEAKELLKNVKEFEFILALKVYFLYFIEHLFMAF